MDAILGDQNIIWIFVMIGTTAETAEQFMKIAPHFKLGCLLTEQQSPHTLNLSSLAKDDLPAGIDRIKLLDVKTIETLKEKIPQLEAMYIDVNDCLESGGRIFMCGCGATGRLALVLETLFRQQTHQLYPQWEDRSIAFMAGGDAALIKSIEDFEDHPEFAHQQLVQLGFRENDLLIGSTEGGQTPWVIGAIWKSTEMTKRKPYILYGNTDEILIQNVERSKEFILSDKINKINCNVGQMALAGSTRMQATTILMHAIGLTLLGCDQLRTKRYPDHPNWTAYAINNVQTLLQYLNKTDFSILVPLIEKQSAIYKQKGQITYITDPYYAISILTDTTERSPTFSLLPFYNRYTDKENKCWCDLKVLNEESEKMEEWNQKVESDWRAMLGGRKIRGLDSQYWDKYKEEVSTPMILGFQMHQTHEFTMCISHPLTFDLGEKVSFPEYPSPCRLSHHSVIKMVLNNLSTLIMGRMNRYENNIMTYVKPTNFKLIDRATRYVLMLRPQSTYQQVVKVIYDIREKVESDAPIVPKVIEVLNNQ